MNVDDARAFVREHHRAVIATRRRDGGVQMSPIGATVDDAGRVVVSTFATAAKARNVRRDPRVSVCVVSDDWYGPWVRIDGTADIQSLPEALEPLVDYYRSIRGEHPDWDEYRQAMHDEHRVLLRITVHRVGPSRRT